jgi:hypothetical protein
MMMRIAFNLWATKCSVGEGCPHTRLELPRFGNRQAAIFSFMYIFLFKNSSKLLALIAEPKPPITVKKSRTTSNQFSMFQCHYNGSAQQITRHHLLYRQTLIVRDPNQSNMAKSMYRFNLHTLNAVMANNKYLIITGN